MEPVLAIVMTYPNRKALKLALAVATVINVHQIGWYRLPPLYESGVRYKRDATCKAELRPFGGCEPFFSAKLTYDRGFGDCDDLAPWRAAELIRGGDFRARAVPVPSSVGWHILVKHGNGTIEDPSKRLGMKGTV